MDTNRLQFLANENFDAFEQVMATLTNTERLRAWTTVALAAASAGQVHLLANVLLCVDTRSLRRSLLYDTLPSLCRTTNPVPKIMYLVAMLKAWIGNGVVEPNHLTILNTCVPYLSTIAQLEDLISQLYKPARPPQWAAGNAAHMHEHRLFYALIRIRGYHHALQSPGDPYVNDPTKMHDAVDDPGIVDAATHARVYMDRINEITLASGCPYVYNALMVQRLMERNSCSDVRFALCVCGHTPQLMTKGVLIRAMDRCSAHTGLLAQLRHAFEYNGYTINGSCDLDQMTRSLFNKLDEMRYRAVPNPHEIGPYEVGKRLRALLGASNNLSDWGTHVTHRQSIETFLANQANLVAGYPRVTCPYTEPLMTERLASAIRNPFS